MNIFERYHLNMTTVLKIVLIALATILVVAAAFRLIGSSFDAFRGNAGVGFSGMEKYVGDDAYNDMAVTSAPSGFAIGLSDRNILPPMPPPSGTVTPGATLEDFEVTEYNGWIETRNQKRDCAAIAVLKDRADVLFESAHEDDTSCSYTFKVERAHADDVLAILKGLHPRELTANTYTIKRVVDDFTSETEILEAKLASINATLASAISAYDDITTIAARTNDAESLARIIDSKIGIIERLTEQRIYTSAQLERLGRSKAEQLDRLVYAVFRVTIVEKTFIDGRVLADSWKNALREFVRDVNAVAQDISINLVAALFVAVQYALYLLITLFVVKYGWRSAVYLWKK